MKPPMRKATKATEMALAVETPIVPPDHFFVSAYSPYSPQPDSDSAKFLSFSAGDLIKVTWWNKTGWWWGECKDRKGWFPSNYTQPAPAGASSYSQAAVAAGGQPVQPPAAKTEQRIVKSKAKAKAKGAAGAAVGGKRKFWNDAPAIEEQPAVPEQQGPGSEYAQAAFFNIYSGRASNKPALGQSMADRACRQMGAYFDYDKWNEERNRQARAKEAAKRR
mmetsp:Transcript_31875/g.79069  ORF Transcript_31875/g.79069 Transcript_31875/m.79069 type:complete len:220 (-) Transcript_31875:245-904(-)